MTHLNEKYETELSNRRELKTGAVKYDIAVYCCKKNSKEKIVETTYTLSKKQEENHLEEMIHHFTMERAEEYENDIGKDFSGKRFSFE